MTQFTFKTSEVANAWETETDDATLKAIIELQMKKGDAKKVVDLCKHIFQNGFNKGRLATQSNIVAAMGLRGVSHG